jgi:hypothetical protein
VYDKAQRAAAVGTVATLLAITYCQGADASFVRRHAAACFSIPSPFWINTQSDGREYWRYTDNTIYNTGNTGEFMCPAPDTNVINRSQWSFLDVETYIPAFSQATPATAMLCEAYWNGWGGGCSTQRSTAGSGHQTIALGGDVSSLWTPNDRTQLGYVFVNLGQFQELRGIYYWCGTGYPDYCPNNN